MSSTPMSSPSRIERDDDLAVRRAVAGDVAGESVDVLDALDLPGLRRRAAHALVESHADARRAALERARAPARRRRCGRSRPSSRRAGSRRSAPRHWPCWRSASGSPATRPSSAEARSRYMVALSAAAILKSNISRTPPFRAPCLTALRCFLLVDALGLRGPARPRRLALALGRYGPRRSFPPAGGGHRCGSRPACGSGGR